MAKTNVSAKFGHTHEGAPAASMTAEQALRRSVMSCFLWEDEFYEDGQEISKRILGLADEIPLKVLSEIAIEAREQSNLRHVPLLLCSAMAKLGSRRYNSNPGQRGIIGSTIARVVQRADELSELLSIHAKLNGIDLSKQNAGQSIKSKIPAQMKKGLAKAFNRFDAYQLAKYDRDNPIRLRDALFLVHPKPDNNARAEMWRGLVEGTLKSPDTWEVGLSTGGDKKETFERLLKEDKMGYLALLRNLRNMVNAGCDQELVTQAITARRGASRVLPFRYIAAARAAPSLEPAIDKALQAAIKELEPLPGKTVVLVDVSSSMDVQLSSKSDMRRVDAAAALAAIINGNVRMFSFSNDLVEVPARRGMAGVDAIIDSQPHGGTRLIHAIAEVNDKYDYDRLIVITDEQSHAYEDFERRAYGPDDFGRRVYCPDPKTRGYMINVASYQKGVGYGEWLHVDGFSENVLKFIHEYEKQGD